VIFSPDDDVDDDANELIIFIETFFEGYSPKITN